MELIDGKDRINGEMDVDLISHVRNRTQYTKECTISEMVGQLLRIIYTVPAPVSPFVSSRHASNIVPENSGKGPDRRRG
jgi:hypothetical protein